MFYKRFKMMPKGFSSEHIKYHSAIQLVRGLTLNTFRHDSPKQQSRQELT